MQPNYKIFNEFNSIYLLSRNGQNIYFGAPQRIVDYFDKFGLVCPAYCNPADYAIEVAYGDYGQEVFDKMEDLNRAIEYSGEGRGNKFELSKVVNKLRSKKLPTLKHTWLLLWRNWGNMFRDSNNFWFKNLQSLLVALMISYIWIYKVGEDDGCWESFNSPVNTTDLKNNLFKINVTAAKDEYIAKISRMADNSAFIFAVILYTMMVSLISCVLTFPMETNIVLREVSNNWYKTAAYFWAKTISDLPPMLLSNLVLGAILWPMTGQIPVYWRFFIFYIVVCMVGEVCQSVGMSIGILISRDIVSAALLTIASAIPIVMFAGFLVRFSSMPWYFKPISYFSYVRYAFEACLIAIYGFDRCQPSESSNFIDELLSATDPMKIASNLWSTFNVTYADVRRFALILNVDEDCLGNVVNNTVEYLGLDPETKALQDADELLDDVTNSTDIMTIEEGQNPSYILSYYNLRDRVIYFDAVALLFYLMLLKLIIYLLLRWKTRATN